ncbi:2-dehydropantoate 2-reductase [Amphritea sp. 1_MG-2023]|uniref:ketopantoate reductase family protein n=1 Tax=Amphritea sp. 1_MG-2023 TaxID=3062670 RepID=UPI0026E2F2F6|nr:2-dehydropantoate 2-reductase [Amphritea sp. 1_MG-2023]MDO6564037.1 2-dehydropantoate 2-reductase [Amphritea sp. 1_MG-2023]
MHWHILGAGAIGLLWAAKLKQAGHRVTLILHTPEKLAQYVEADGFSLTDGATTERFNPPAQLAAHQTPITHLLITTKSFAVIDAFTAVRSRLVKNARLWLLHNGMGPQQQLTTANPQLEVWAGSTTDGAYFDAPWHLIRAGTGTTQIGRLSNSGNDDLFEALSKVDNQLSLATDMTSVLWRKLAINCAINPLTALYNCRNGELLKYTDRRAAMAQLCKEVDEVAHALGITLFERKLMEQAWDVAELTADNYSSMQQDISHQRPTEIETITGYFCAKADQAHIATPANHLVLEAIRNMSKGNGHD